MLKDGMAGFQLFQPTDIDSALDLLESFGEGAWPLAGGYDSLDWFKDRIRSPEAVIDLDRIPELRGVRVDGDRLEIGAMTTLSEVEAHARIRADYGLLADAAGRVASPQIRNVGTIGGNVCQDTRCWYYRSGVSCYRAGGNTCYAAAPDAMNREHAIFGANRCVAVSPSDVATALVALEADFVVRNTRGERIISADDFFMEPSVDITRMTVLEPGDLLVSIRLSGKWAGAAFHYEKVAERNTWDFALVSIAAAFRETPAGIVEEARIVCGAVQCVPRRLNAVERLVKNTGRTEEVAAAAGSLAVRGAEPLDHNAYKIPLMENLVKRTIQREQA